MAKSTYSILQKGINMKQIILKSFVLDKGDIERIKEWNAANTKNVSKLAKKLGISRQFLYMLLKGRQKVSSKLYKRFVSLGIFTEELL